MRGTRAHRHDAAAGGAANAALYVAGSGSDSEAGPASGSGRGAGTAHPTASRRRSRTAAGTGAAAVLAALLAATAAGCASSANGTQGASASSPSSVATAGASGASGAATGAGAGASASPSGNGGAGGGATANAQAGAGPACSGAQLKVTTADGGAAAGHLSMVLLFANTGSAACALGGYPGAAVSGSGGSTLLNAQRTLSGYTGGAHGVDVVTVAPGTSASALLEWSDVPTGSGCPGAGATALLITPPNTTATTSLAPINEVCSGFQIHPVVSGTSGRSGT